MISWEKRLTFLRCEVGSLAVGVGWLGACAARAFSVVRDNSRSGANLGGIAMEGLIGLSMLLPWDSFIGR